MCELRMQHLQRHQSVVVNVVGEVDRGDAPTAELAFDAVAVGQGGLEAGSAVGQREVLREVHGSTAFWSRLEIAGASGVGDKNCKSWSAGISRARVRAPVTRGRRSGA